MAFIKAYFVNIFLFLTLFLKVTLYLSLTMWGLSTSKKSMRPDSTGMT